MAELLFEGVKTVLLGLLTLFVLLLVLANAYPQATWLRRFRLPEPYHSRFRTKRTGRMVNIKAGLQLIGLGLFLPFGYLFSTVTMFSDVNPLVMWLLGAGSVVCIGFGVRTMFSAGDFEPGLRRGGHDRAVRRDAAAVAAELRNPRRRKP
jgi:peptidoglycan/LPS O-acetylase OafA/YrhL